MNTDKRARILEAALELFTEYGFKGTSTAAIAQHAGVATGTLFHHFKTKEDLIDELYKETKIALAESLAFELDGVQGVRNKIQSMWLGFVDWALEHEDKYRFFKHCEASPYIGEELKEECAAKFAFLFDLFAQAVEAGVVKNLPVPLHFALTTGMAEGFIRHLMQHPEDRDSQSLRTSAFSMCWDAMR
jgi:AcrR family transcriptional regulator